MTSTTLAERRTAPTPNRALAWAIIAVVAIALNLRTPIAAVSALLDHIQSGLSLDSAAVTLLTTLPTAALSIFAFVGPAVRRKIGDRGVVAWCTLALAVGNIIRLGDSTALLFTGTIVVSAAIGLANVAIPSLIKQSLPERFSVVTAVYTAVMTAGAGAAAGLASILAETTGSSWRIPLALLTIPVAVIAMLVWLSPQPWHRPVSSERSSIPTPTLLRFSDSRTLRTLTVFFGTTTLLAYAVLGWLPVMVHNSDIGGAEVLSVATISQIAGSAMGPALLRRVSDQRGIACAAAILTAVSLALVVSIDNLALVVIAAIVLGIAQGLGFNLALTLIGLRTADAQTAARVSAKVQGVGYLFGVVGTLGVGLLHTLSGSWAVPTALLLLVGVAQLWSGFLVGRSPVIDTSATTSTQA